MGIAHFCVWRCSLSKCCTMSAWHPIVLVCWLYLTVTAYHQNTFGSMVGLLLDLNLLTIKNRLLMMSLISWTVVYVVFLGYGVFCLCFFVHVGLADDGQGRLGLQHCTLSRCHSTSAQCSMALVCWSCKPWSRTWWWQHTTRIPLTAQ